MVGEHSEAEAGIEEQAAPPEAGPGVVAAQGSTGAPPEDVSLAPVEDAVTPADLDDAELTPPAGITLAARSAAIDPDDAAPTPPAGIAVAVQPSSADLDDAAPTPPAGIAVAAPPASMDLAATAPAPPADLPDPEPLPAVSISTGEAPVDLSVEPDYPPPNSVPRPPPPTALKVYPTPAVDEISPSRGPAFVETRVTLIGKHLFRASIVRFDGVIAQTVGADEPRELRVLSPPRERAGEVDVTIENPFSPPAVLAKAFRYEALAAPEIASVAPDHVATHKPTEITVMGKNFVRGAVVLLDGRPAEKVRFVSSTAIDVTAPPGEHGKLVDVSVKNPDGATAIARRAFVRDERYG